MHQARFPVDSFNPTPQPSALDGGRFDSLDGSYASLYVGDSEAAAIAETLCRDLPFDGRAREVPRTALAGRLLSAVEVVEDVAMVNLHGAALTQVGQDGWLTKSEARDYVLTRRWATAIRGWVPAAGGFECRCRHDEDLLAWVLFSDPSVDPPPPKPVRALPGQSVPLSSVRGQFLVSQVLEAHNAVLGRP